MTQNDRLQLLISKSAELGQAEVARQIGYHPSTVNQIIKGTYNGDSSIVLQRVEEVFGSTTVTCPILGKITLGKCAEIRKRPFAPTNPTRVQLYRACKKCGGVK